MLNNKQTGILLVQTVNRHLFALQYTNTYFLPNNKLIHIAVPNNIQTHVLLAPKCHFYFIIIFLYPQNAMCFLNFTLICIHLLTFFHQVFFFYYLHT